MNTKRNVCLLFILLLILAAVVTVFQQTGVADLAAAARAHTEASRANAEAALAQAQGDLALKSAAAAAVRADTAVATAYALWPIWAALLLCCGGALLISVTLFITQKKGNTIEDQAFGPLATERAVRRCPRQPV